MSPPPPKTPKKTVFSAYEAAEARTLRWQLMTLVIVLTFEGVARKLRIPGMSIPIFFCKDLIVLIMGFQLIRMNRPRAVDFLWLSYLAVMMLFLPVILSTAIHDPILAVFGAKQYLLYPIVGLAVFSAFHDCDVDTIIRFFRWTSLLIIPTTVMALVQLHLPPSHWLNLSVDGEDLAGFSAGGKLRVSSTFSFVAQYTDFLTAEVYMLVIAFTRPDTLKFYWKIIYLSLVPLLVLGEYVTGSRGAVVGATMIIAFAGALSTIKFQLRNTFRLGTIVLGLVVMIGVAQHFLPDEFAAYSARQQGQLIGINQNIQSRAFDSFFNWMGNAFSTPPFGNGIGVMSNGSENLSDYAAHIRDYAGWTETDFASTLFEGGMYLVLVWYGFRYFVIFQTLRRFLADMNEELSMPASFCLANVILLGLTATLGIQPPLAIWWWISVGTSLILWWKCVEPKRDKGGVVIVQPTVQEKKLLRGRSAYADRLHR